MIGSLILGMYGDDAGRLAYTGGVGTGFTQQILTDLARMSGSVRFRLRAGWAVARLVAVWPAGGPARPCGRADQRHPTPWPHLGTDDVLR
jgi:hypothetical protein